MRTPASVTTDRGCQRPQTCKNRSDTLEQRGNSMPGMMGAEEARKYFENVVGRKTAPRK